MAAVPFIAFAALLLSVTGVGVLAYRRGRRDATRATEARLQFLGEHARDVVMRLAGDQTILDVSPSIRRFGYEPADLVGQPAGRRTHADDRESLLALFNGLSPGRRDTGEMQEWRALTADGRWVWMEGDVTVLAAAGGAVEYVLVMRDIDERRRATEAISTSESRYRLLAENSRDAVFAFDMQGRIRYASPSIRSIGWEPEVLIGRSCFDFVHPDDVATARAAMAAVLRRDPAAGELSREWRIRTSTGDYLWVEGNPSVSWSDDGQAIAWSDSVRDISRRKALEADLRIKRQEAEAAEARARESLDELARVARALTVGEFATSIAHELNQPLAAIVTNGDTALRWLSRSPADTDEVRRAVERAIRDARRASDIMGRTRAMLEKSAPNLGSLSVSTCIDEVLAFTAAQLRRRRIAVRRTVEAGLPEALGDRVQIQQVLLNLVRNAAEAMADNAGFARVLEVTASLAEDSQQILVRVDDNGCGIDNDAASRLFEGFFTTKPGGVGLGLSISRSIIEAHGGRLWATARDGRGASFQFTLRTTPEPEV